MKSILYFLLILSLSCVASEKKSSSGFSSDSLFDKISIGTSAEPLKITAGNPQEEGRYDIEGVHFNRWTYRDSKNVRVWFLIDPAQNKVVEKLFFPDPNSQESNLEYLKRVRFKGVTFEKVFSRCAHFGELVYFNKSLGVSIISREGEGIPVTAIGAQSPELMDLRKKEEQRRKCAHNSETN